jgi:hypothetical protein
MAMNNGPDNLGDGPATAEDRFAGQLGYRGPSRRDLGGLSGDPTGDLGRRNGASSNIGSPNIGSPSINSMLDASTLPTAPSMSLNELDSLSEPVFPPAGWLDPPVASGDPSTGSLADHPLLRGLLLELPPKGTMPTADWLDRWFEAARSILELLYVQSAGRR